MDNCIDVSLTGHLNQAIFSVNDGVETTYFVGNNDNDDTEMYLVARIPAFPGAVLEFNTINSIKNYSSDTMDQVNQNTTHLWHFRALEAKWITDSYGTLSLGFGETASDNSAEVDFTPVYFVQYSEVFDIYPRNLKMRSLVFESYH